MRISLSDLRSGKSAEPVILGDYKPIKVYMDKDKLFVDVSLYGGSEQPPLEVKHNQFVLRNPRWDRNFDSVALEIVDESTSPIFQLMYVNPYKIIVNGIFYSPSGLVLAGNYFRGSINSSMIPADFSIKRLFKYPSDRFLGKRIPIPRIIIKPQLKERAISLANELAKLAGREEAARESLRNGMGGPSLAEVRKDINLTYREQYLSKCESIVEELDAAGLLVGVLPALCQSTTDGTSVQYLADKIMKVAEQL